MPDETPPAIPAEVLALSGVTSSLNALSEKVGALAQSVTLTNETNERLQDQADTLKQTVSDIEDANTWLRRGAGGLLLLIVLLIGGFVWLWNVADAAHDATEATKANAVTNCQNTNEARKGTRRLWLGIIDAPRPEGSPARTEGQEQQVADLRQFVEDLFQERDCQNLDRKYPLPELPDSLKPRSE